MTFLRSLLPVLTVVCLASCSAGARDDGPVRPAPPGPVDALRSLWGDYSGRCPANYAYCHGGPNSLCCPSDQRCCEDSQGAYCCSAERRYDDFEPDFSYEDYERYERSDRSGRYPDSY